MLFTMKYGIPSAKYNVGIHHHGDFKETGRFIIVLCVVSNLSNIGPGRSLQILLTGTDASRIIVKQNVPVTIAAHCHHRSAYLAQTHPVAPSGAKKRNRIISALLSDDFSSRTTKAELFR